MTETLTVDLRRYIDRQFFGDQPHVRGKRVPVWVIARTLRDNPGYGVPELMYDFTLSEIEVLAALLYYEQNRDAIESALAEAHETYKSYYGKG